MKKTLISIVLVIALLMSQISIFAAFDDMNEERLSWAKTAVDEMTEAGLIYGYGDGTFRPDNSVTKQETLVLIARVLGINEESSVKFNEIAKETYAEALSEYSMPYKEDVSYLLYRGILTPEDLALYVSDSEATEPLKRYEAAVLFTKIFEKDLEAVENAEISINFEDLGDIPANAKPYVNYVCENEIMYGTSDKLFAPNEKLTRAMIATLLHRIIPEIDYSYLSGELLRYDEKTSSIRISGEGEEVSTLILPKDASVVLDGINTSIDNFKAGAKVRVTYSGDKIIFVEGISSTFETTITGIYNGYDVYEDATTIIIKDAKTGKSESYVISSSITVTKNGKPSSISKLLKSDYISASIKAGKVLHIEAEDKIKTVSGVLETIVFEPDFALNVNVDGEKTHYDTTENVYVKRNNKEVDLSSLAAGDKVTLTIEYGYVSKIVATSTSDIDEGVITEIIISNTPSITIDSKDNGSISYYIGRNAKISASEGDTIYDLRLGDTIKVNTEGKTITSLSTVTSSASSTNVSGVVESVQTSYGYIKLVNSSSLIFTNKAKIQNSSGSALTLKAIKAGDTITVFGTASSGAIEATLIIVNQ